MSMAPDTQIDVRRLIFPIIAGRETAQGFSRTGLVGTGFFVGRRGLALTAAHVISGVAEGTELRAALPTSERPMRAHMLRWAVTIPGSDIAVLRVDVSTTACFAVRFEELPMGQDVQTTAIPEAMLETDPTGRTQVLMRCAKGYVSHGQRGWIAASFALPKGMSGAPLVATTSEAQFVAGVFVGQTRGEQIEDLVEEVSDLDAGGLRTHVERVARVEYFARGELLAPYASFVDPQFDGLKLQALIERDVQPSCK